VAEDWLVSSLVLLRQESPWHYAGVARALEGWPLTVTLGQRLTWLDFTDGHHRLLASPPDGGVRLAAGLAEILALVDGHRSLAAAIRAGGVQVQAPLAALDALHSAWEHYLHGAVRAPSFPRLLSRMRASGRSDSPALR